MEKKTGMILGILLILAFCLAGCGRQEESQSFQDIRREIENFSNGAESVDTSDMIEYVNLGSQFWKGERIQLWGERNLEGGSIYFHREDGSRELLAERVSGHYLGGDKWWIDEEKRCYILKSDGILGMDGDGTERFYNKTGKNVKSICQMKDGRIIILTWGDQGEVLAELDPDSGKLEEIQNISMDVPGVIMIATEDDEVFLLSREGIWDANLREGTVENRISFAGTSYVLENNQGNKRKKEDFRFTEEGGIELLWSDGTAEFLKEEEINKEKEVLVFRIANPSSWMKEQIVKFNQSNSDYYINIEEMGDSDWDSFCDRTDLDLSVGKGADIVCSDAVKNAYSLLEKGVFQDLTPYMEKAGIQEENYFPAAFSGWKQGNGIFGLSCVAQVEGLWISQAVIGETELSEIEDLLDCLLTYEGDAVFLRYNASKLLKFFLINSENLCGLVDLEGGTCNFGGELFEKLLETAQRYGYDEKKEAYERVADRIYYNNYYDFLDSSYLTESGKIPVGFWFDDGWHEELKSNILAINGSSSKKAGAWEFLNFLLSEEIQMSFLVDESDYLKVLYFPMEKNAFEELCVKHAGEINNGYDIKTLSETGEIISIATSLTEDRKKELKEVLEGARPAPFSSGPVLDLILEEAEGYFSGTKTIDQVRDSLENRVRLFLNEKN